MLALGYADFPVLAYHFQSTQLVKPADIPLMFAGAMGLEGLAALFFGKLFDHVGIGIFSVGILISLVGLPLGFLGGSAAAVTAVACWAIGMGAQDACLRGGISQVVSMNKRGSAFGDLRNSELVTVLLAVANFGGERSTAVRFRVRRGWLARGSGRRERDGETGR